jgi:pyruvate/2-oxoglutarate dehydrogenase complex dihydrolipoamide dehydrogenase (E3) component
MSPEQVEVLILGSGQGGKLLAWHVAQSGRRTAVVERRWIGGSCPNIACMPSKNEIWSARVAHLAHHAGNSAPLQVRSRPIWPRYVSASLTWSTARSNCTCKTTVRAVPN